MHLVYLHGFASGPDSTKGGFLKRRLAEFGYKLHQPDLNAPAFEAMTISSQLAVIARTLEGLRGPVTLLGSSMGGLLAVLQATRDPRIERLVLMAPAFGFARRWQERLGAAAVAEWRRSGKLAVYHYAYRRECRLGFEMLTDALGYDETQPGRPVPTLILHGRRDEVVDFELSRAFAASRPNVALRPYDTDHAMIDVLEPMWQKIRAFLKLERQGGHPAVHSS
ncbi:MAG: alpha/beta fold hydrolase [Aphanocapsa lilacina HA4352-LM1]|jgi:pimeloyl-ACP methyl ester carboxylesterase|nr:alpha/beta fold hydrolase [Aphanocapsa lilacina HA4352-LM1]